MHLRRLLKLPQLRKTLTRRELNNLTSSGPRLDLRRNPLSRLVEGLDSSSGPENLLGADTRESKVEGHETHSAESSKGRTEKKRAGGSGLHLPQSP